MNYQTMLKRLLKHEGGYVNHPEDPGGETCCGVSRRWYPKWEGWTLLDRGFAWDSAEVQQAVSDFYYAYYYAALRLHTVKDQELAELLFNFSVNIGKKTAVRKLQRVLGLEQDGLIGPATLAALDNCDRDRVAFQFLLEVLELYAQLSKDKPMFFKGWTHRVVQMYYAYINHQNA